MSITIMECEATFSFFNPENKERIYYLEKPFSYYFLDLELVYSNNSISLESNTNNFQNFKKRNMLSYNFAYSDISILRNLVVFLYCYKYNKFDKKEITEIVSKIRNNVKSMKLLNSTIQHFDIMSNPTSNTVLNTYTNLLESINTNYSSKGFSISLGNTFCNINYEKNKSSWIFSIIHKDSIDSENFTYIKHLISLNSKNEIIEHYITCTKNDSEWEIVSFNNSIYMQKNGSSYYYLTTDFEKNIMLNIKALILSSTNSLQNYLT